jgi:hypothetical protein
MERSATQLQPVSSPSIAPFSENSTSKKKTKEISYSKYNDIFNWASKETSEIPWLLHVDPSVRHCRFRFNLVCGAAKQNCVNLSGGTVF